MIGGTIAFQMPSDDEAGSETARVSLSGMKTSVEAMVSARARFKCFFKSRPPVS